MSAHKEINGISPTDALSVVNALAKQISTLKLLKESTDNDDAIGVLVDCHNTVAAQIPGVPALEDVLAVKVGSPVSDYKQQMKQSMFSTTGVSTAAPKADETNLDEKAGYGLK